MDTSRLGIFKWSLLATALAIVGAAVYGGLGAASIVAVLIALEGSISFDNAVVNAGVLRRMSDTWQKAFLTVGIVIAVFGMRIVFPVAIVAVATGLGFVEAATQALTDKQAYAAKVDTAAPIIGAFGGTFLLMVALNFFLDSDREVDWIRPVERPLRRAGGLPGLPAATSAIAIVVVSQVVAAGSERDVLLSGIVGLATYLVLRGISELLTSGQQGSGRAAGAAGFAAFAYLEMLDASFSLDGVLGAFAITTDIVLIAIGLGVGALFVRSMTIYLVRERALSRYRYLANGAHWAIAVLAVVLYASVEVHVPEWLTASVGLSAIVAAFVSSTIHNRRERGAPPPRREREPRRTDVQERGYAFRPVPASRASRRDKSRR